MRRVQFSRRCFFYLNEAQKIPKSWNNCSLVNILCIFLFSFSAFVFFAFVVVFFINLFALYSSLPTYIWMKAFDLECGSWKNSNFVFPIRFNGNRNSKYATLHLFNVHTHSCSNIFARDQAELITICWIEAANHSLIEFYAEKRCHFNNDVILRLTQAKPNV